jgi:uncharacterized protein YbjT (DUF2867 family)
MPVLVTGAEERLGHATIERMLRIGGEVRVWLDAEISGDADAHEWRARGCKTAIGAADDEGRLEAALEQVHTVAHLAGGPLADPGAATDQLATVVSAALGAGCRRLIWVTDLAVSMADELASPGGYVSSLAERAGIVAELPMDLVVVRTGLRYGPDDGLTRLLADHADALDAATPHAPVWIDDVAAAVVAADAQRGSGTQVRIEVDLAGPEVVPLAKITRALAGVPALREHAPALTPAVRDWLAVPAVADDDALGGDGRTFADGVRVLAQAPDEGVTHG